MSKKQKKYSDKKYLEDMVEQATKLGIGFAIVSKEALEDLIKKATKTQGISGNDAKQAVTRLVKESKRREKQISDKVITLLKEAKANNPVISRTEIIKMKAEIAKLKQQQKKKKK